MIHEYALEPELVATWYQRELFRHFIERFGFRDEDGSATGRVVGQYPNKKWIKQVWETFNANFGQSAREDERERVTELLKQLTIPQVRRSGSTWNDQYTWLKNAEEENERHQFHAILACNPSDNPQVICGEDVLPGMNPPSLWSVPREKPVPRTATSIATHLEPMLRCATRILFIDPHFRARPSRWQEPLRRFLKTICDGSREVTLEYHVSACYTKAPPWDEFLDECKQILPSLIPRNFALTVRRWKDWDVDEELHDRYILTDIGGVAIPKGLSEKDRDTIDILRLSVEIWQQRLENYGFHYYDDRASSGSKPKPAFDPGDPPETVTISGT